MAQYNETVSESGHPLPPSREGVVRVRTGMSPLYVLITLQDPQARTKRELCVANQSLGSAIAHEHRLDLADDQREIFDIAIAAPRRVFSFRNRKAREVLKPAYTPKQLAYVRRLLQGKPRRWLVREARWDVMNEPDQQGFVTRIYRREIGKRIWSSSSLRVAVRSGEDLTRRRSSPQASLPFTLQVSRARAYGACGAQRAGGG